VYNNNTASISRSGSWQKAGDFLFFEECGALLSRRYGKDTTRFLAGKYQ
jgi:zona occludens toxin (predicted ATPase)